MEVFKKKNGYKTSDVKLYNRIWTHRDYYLLALPAIIYVAVFCYVPMYGLQIAFKNYRMSLGVMNSPWVGFRNFTDFFNSYSFWRLMENTFVLSFYQIIVGFPMPVIVALVLNELKGGFKRTVQTVLYAPHFISTVVIVSMLVTMFSPSVGVVNTMLETLGMKRIYFFGSPDYFRHLYVWSGVWQQMGWNAIIYLAALSGVDPELLEAAQIDGATRMQRITKINLPTILPTVVIMLILQMGKIANVAYEKVYLMQTELNLDTSEVISTFVYKRGLEGGNYSYSTAVGLFNNLINIMMLFVANKISKKVSETSLF